MQQYSTTLEIKVTVNNNKMNFSCTDLDKEKAPKFAQQNIDAVMLKLVSFSEKLSNLILLSVDEYKNGFTGFIQINVDEKNNGETTLEANDKIGLIFLNTLDGVERGDVDTLNALGLNK
ncbi:hypothetical protein [Phocoenobacter skyensis]|uniref:Uncharacterized protein n=1 Tax=Phocoenobacter skyensis TaxID=97481 RepID=A0ABT9JKT4_9PAST|nr:hypothetical protein [Pasteurella skyensis]MDP8079539.1 hypothetical protein [Pasteurella skyensis]MDP8085411.1 hypothetical protein [Pasteurella skyensis]